MRSRLAPHDGDKRNLDEMAMKAGLADDDDDSSRRSHSLIEARLLARRFDFSCRSDGTLRCGMRRSAVAIRGQPY